ncbi:MAG: PilZ domain-containing protein, partial [Spirochaetota bacterium]
MKALLLVEDDDKALEIGGYVETLGIDVVRYRNPIKALDNLDEVAPQIIIASALDFPRHWKIIADVVRSAKSRQDCLIILMRGERFSAEEEAK